jgi:glycerol-3-phosphate dehydrogenase
MARTLGDIVLRRTGIGTLGHPGRAVLEKVAALAASELGWDEVETKRQIASTSEQLTPPVPDAVKHHFEPNNVMNPGGQPGHDSR